MGRLCLNVTTLYASKISDFVDVQEELFCRCPSYLARLKLTKNNYSDRASRFIAETLFKAPVNLKATLRCLGQEERCQCSRDTVNETVSFKIKSIRKKTDAF